MILSLIFQMTSLWSNSIGHELIPIEQVRYERNSKAKFCKRPIEMIDTIVLHHTESPSTTTPERINDFHLLRGTKDDPWYMIAYSYVINSPYSGENIPRSRVTEGRPLEIVGAHAGSNVFVSMDEEQKRIWDQNQITCGTENTEFKVDPEMVRDGKIKANVTTLGVVVIGNYAPFSRTNPGGYRPENPRNPTSLTLDLIAKLSCQLQKNYPKIKNIKWHNFYMPTTCPGTVKKYVENIKLKSRNYGCEFN